jgi:hypothetical protein
VLTDDRKRNFASLVSDSNTLVLFIFHQLLVMKLLDHIGYRSCFGAHPAGNRIGGNAFPF